MSEDSNRPHSPKIRTEEPPRCLFVISHDFGELGFAQSLLIGSHLAANACVLLPEHLYSLNKDALPCASKCYRNFDDIRALSTAYAPHLVFLLSGYLLWPDRIASIPSLKRWTANLRATGCVIVTSDPFLGLTGSIVPSNFAEEFIWDRPANSMFGKCLRFFVVKAAQFHNTLQFRRMHSIFVHASHVYAMPVEHLEFSQKVRCYGFWNNALLPLADQSPTREQPVWLFVLSQMDYEVQCRNLGEENLSDLLAEKLEQSVTLGRLPILIGPANLVAQLERRLAVEYHPSLLASSSYAEFQELLITAEQVFYWNMLSHSMYMRFVLRRPIQFFARGHVAHMFPPLHDRAIRTYYDGKEPELNDMTQPLVLDVLAQKAAVLQQDMSGLLARMRAFSSPDSLVNELLGHGSLVASDPSNGPS